MHLAIVSHKPIYESTDSPSGYATDGGFPLQIGAISELFETTVVVVPCIYKNKEGKGLTFLQGNKLEVVPLSFSKAKGIWRKMTFPFWLILNWRIIWKEIRRSDAVHAPIPGDIGTIGLYIALLLRKPLFVRHCGNWLVQRTIAERFWKWTMEHFAGGRNVMLATGGTDNPPSQKNSNIKWIFSTSLARDFVENAVTRDYPADGCIKMITACRLEDGKGVEVVIDGLALVLKQFPKSSLDIVGGGSIEKRLKRKAEDLGLGQRIRFHGKVEQSMVIELMKQSHVFCLPSLSEGFPKVVIEALGCGLPVVTTKVSVLPRLVGNGSGILIDEPTGTNVAEAITRIFADNDTYLSFSKSAIGTARHYSLESWKDFIGENLRNSWNVSSLSSEKASS